MYLEKISARRGMTTEKNKRLLHCALEVSFPVFQLPVIKSRVSHVFFEREREWVPHESGFVQRAFLALGDDFLDITLHPPFETSSDSDHVDPRSRDSFLALRSSSLLEPDH
jgi:hypothetical protein